MSRPLRIGITCFATYGGSGVVATEVGLGLAARGHDVHFIARSLPFRLPVGAPGVTFHPVHEPDHAVLRPDSAYPIALASALIEVSRQHQLDVLHVHYAVPHATAAWLARDVLGPDAPALVTTLHGTDITLVGSDSTYLPIVRASILKSDAVTTPSAWLREATWQRLDLPRTLPIDVIANFVDATAWYPAAQPDRAPLRALFADLAPHEAVLAHVSNFRPIKRLQDVVAVFARVHAQRPARLLLIGDGPDRVAAEHQLVALGLSDRVAFLGRKQRFLPWLQAADVFLLPSENESFGLAALEAMAVGLPVLATDVGGLPEVVVHGETGWLSPLGDVDAMAHHALQLLADPALQSRMGGAARARVLAAFQPDAAVARYEAVYRRVLAKNDRR